MFFRNFKENSFVTNKIYYLLVTLIFFISLYFALPLLDAYFYIIDDHQIILNSEKINSIETLLEYYKSSEIASFGSGDRYRPAYFSIYGLEIFLWGDNAFLWYFTRAAGFALFMSLLYVILSRFSIFLAFCFVLFQLGRSYWYEIFGRLGPAEFYAAIALMLFIYFIIRSIENKRQTLGIFFGGLFSIVLIGVKENFIFIIPVYIAYVLLIWKKIDLANKVVALVSILSISFIFVMTVVMVLNLENDIYMYSLDAASRLSSLFNKSSIDSIEDFIPALILAFVLFYYKILNAFQSLLIGFLFLVYLFQIIFYNGIFYPRYMFPFQIILDVSYFIIIVGVVNFVSEKTTNSKVLFRCIFSIFGFIFSVLFLYASDLKYKFNNVSVKTKIHKENINSVYNYSILNNSDLVFVVGAPGSGEPVSSVKKFLDKAGVSSNYILQYVGPGQKKFASHTLEYRLIGKMLELQKGNKKSGFKNKRSTKECLYIYFQSDPIKGECNQGPLMWPLKVKNP